MPKRPPTAQHPSTHDTSGFAPGNDRLAPSPATLALVDIASVCPSGSEQDHVDALDLVGLMVRSACGATPLPGEIHEVECRVYGGFRDIAGTPTERRAWLARNLSILRGLKGGIRIVPHIVDSIACAPNLMLIGTLANGRQTMVDGMIVEDAHLFARSGIHSSILLISDDDDFVPLAVTLSRTTKATLRWVRQRAVGRNDKSFGLSIQLLTDSRWV